LRLAPGTIADGFKRIEPLLTPIYEALRRHHVKSRFFHADETRWRVFVEKAGKIGHQWWLWLFASDDSVVYVLDPGRSHDVPQKYFPDDARIPMDNNAAERKIRNPAVGRKNYYGSGAEWAGRLAMMLFSIFATLAIWKINPRTWLTWYFDACATNAGRAPENVEIFMPWNLSEERLAELRNPHGESFPNTS